MADKRRSSGLPEKAALSVHACSSEDGVHKASNVVLDVLYRQWQTSGATDSAWITIDLDPPSAIQRLAINNAGSALVEAYGLQEGASEGDDGVSDDVSGYEMLLPAQQFMSAADVREKKNTNREFVYEAGTKLLKSAAEHKWQRLKVVCKQPFGAPEEPIGLARVRVFPCKTSAEEAATTRHAAREAKIQAAVADSDSGQKKPPPPAFRMPLAKLSDEPADLADPPPRDPPKPTGKRVLPSWLSGAATRSAGVSKDGQKGTKRSADEGLERDTKKAKMGQDGREKEEAKNERKGAVSNGRGSGGKTRGGKRSLNQNDDEEELEEPSTRAKRKKGPSPQGTRKARAQTQSNEEGGSDTEPESGAAGRNSGTGGGYNGAKAPFEKLLDGVTFAISGIQNPERGRIREQGEEMGAKYRGDWGGECTLLVCAYKGTPKFNQVKKANGTIVDRNWIPECHNRGELVDIDEHLLHPGKPWRKQTGHSLDEGEVRTDRAEQGKKGAEGNAGGRNEQSGTANGREKGLTETEGGKTERSVTEEEEAKPLKGSSRKFRGRENGRREGLRSVTNVDVASWVTADVAAAERFLEGEGAEPGPGETMRELGVQGVLSCFDFLVEELEAGLSLEEAKDGWVASLPEGIQVVCEQADGSADSAISLLRDMKSRYENVLESERHELELGSHESGGEIKKAEERDSDAETEAIAEEGHEGEGEHDVLVLTRQEVAAAKQNLIKEYGGA